MKHAKAGVRTLLCSQPNIDTAHWPSALRQWAEQRLRKSLKLLHVPDPVRPLPPFAAKVMVKNRQWSRKTPHDAKAMMGTVLCPAANIPNASVLWLASGHFYVAPVVYQNILDPVQFEGHVAEDIPPAPSRRIRGKTSRASVARGESGGATDDVGSFGDSGLGGAASGGEIAGDEGDEFEGVVPDSVLFDGVEDSPGSALHDGVGDSEPIVSLKNLWSEPLKCKLCEAIRTDSWISDRCDSCGTWQGRILTPEESEKEAEKLLNREGFVSRCDLNHLLATSLSGWTSSTRVCDREAGIRGSSGLTLGLYVYGSKVGLTKSCLRRLYLKQNTCQASWTALRVTCNFEASPHRDRNAPGSMNVVAPISWFKGGRIWVEGDPPPGCDEKPVVKEFQGKQLHGHYVGGSRAVAQFDPGRAHAVEPSVGNRRVVVGYSPRLIDRLPPSDMQKLKELGFPVPKTTTDELTISQASKAQAKGGDKERLCATSHDKTTRKEGDSLTDRGEEDSKAGVSPGGDGSNPGGWRIRERLNSDELEEAHREFIRVRHLEIESRKFLDEQLEFDVDSTPGGDLCSEDHPVSHVLEMKVRDLEKWLVQHDALGQLHDGMLGDEDTRVLRARLRSMNLTCPGDSGDNPEGEIEVPLSDEPLSDPQDSGNQVKNAADQWQAVPAGPLQTVTISNKEFLENLSVWRPCAEEELSSIFETHRALRRTTQAQVDALAAAGVTVEVLPAKAIFQRKAVSGRNKCRVVACGNYESGASSRSAEKRLSHYAGGLDAIAMRAQLRACGRRVAAGHDHVAAIADVRTAFLRAPLELPNKVIVLRPPRVLIAASLAAEGELWTMLQSSEADLAGSRFFRNSINCVSC